MKNLKIILYMKIEQYWSFLLTFDIVSCFDDICSENNSIYVVTLFVVSATIYIEYLQKNIFSFSKKSDGNDINCKESVTINGISLICSFTNVSKILHLLCILENYNLFFP